MTGIRKGYIVISRVKEEDVNIGRALSPTPAKNYIRCKVTISKANSLASGEVHLKTLVSEQWVSESFDLLNARPGYPLD